MPVLPAEIPTGLVTGQFYFVSEDAADANTDPELEVVSGFVRFTSSAPVLRMPTKRATIIPLTFDAKFNANGELVSEGDPSIGLKLPATDSDLINPKDYTWRADFFLRRTSDGHTVQIPAFSFSVPTGGTVDLTTVMPVQVSNGVQIIQGPEGKAGKDSTVPGPPGPGVPSGGTAGQMLSKTASSTEWATLTKSLVGLGKVDNTADADKPVSDAQAEALKQKLDRGAAEETYLNKTEAGTTYAPVVKGGRIRAGDGALGTLPDSFGAGANATIVALGRDAMGKMKQVAQSIAIGSQALGNSLMSRDNIAIGDASLKNAQALTPWYDQTKMEGTRNIAIGGNASYFLSSGYSNVAIGRNAGQCQVAGYGAVFIGSGAAAGSSPIGFSGEIENGAPWGSDGQAAAVTLVGLSTAEQNSSQNITGVGAYALQRNKRSAFNTAAGVRALQSIDADTGPNGGRLTALGTLSGSYAQSGNVVTLTVPAHTLAAGDIVKLRLLDGGSQTFQGDQVNAPVTAVVSPNVFTVAHPVSRSATGSAEIYSKESGEQLGLAEHNTAVGQSAGASQKTGGWNTYLGSNAAQTVPHATNSVAIGYVAAQNAGMLTRATLIGAGAAAAATNTLLNVTAVGQAALSKTVDGAAYTASHENVTGIGYDSRVSGANQVQLGNSATTTYVYGTVQNRSDARDKADVRDTELGLDFIEKLRPVDYRWDMREDYFEEDEDGNHTVVPKDGSKKRSRYHHGFIAQEVQQVIEETGIDFGGLQDHSVNGGADVLSIGYDEVIAPLVKAVQELSARVAELEAQR